MHFQVEACFATLYTRADTGMQESQAQYKSNYDRQVGETPYF